MRYATDAAANGWGEKRFEYIDRFAAAFKAHLGVKFAIATSSCTGALHMGWPRWELVRATISSWPTPTGLRRPHRSFIWVQGRSSLISFPRLWCLDPDLVEKAITPRTKAIIAVHMYGNLCDMDRLLAIGEKHGIPVIEDAAEAIGSVYHGKRAGSMGKFGAFSRSTASKTITTGEGGMFVTDDPELHEKVLTLSNHGRARGQTKQLWPDIVGFKYKMSNLQAAVGLAQVERINELTSRKREIFQAYHDGLAGVGYR